MVSDVWYNWFETAARRLYDSIRRIDKKLYTNSMALQADINELNTYAVNFEKFHEKIKAEGLTEEQAKRIKNASEKLKGRLGKFENHHGDLRVPTTNVINKLNEIISSSGGNGMPLTFSLKKKKNASAVQQKVKKIESYEKRLNSVESKLEGFDEVLTRNIKAAVDKETAELIKSKDIANKAVIVLGELRNIKFRMKKIQSDTLTVDNDAKRYARLVADKNNIAANIITAEKTRLDTISKEIATEIKALETKLNEVYTAINTLSTEVKSIKIESAVVDRIENVVTMDMREIHKDLIESHKFIDKLYVTIKDTIDLVI